jgi:hypothetical protein
MQHGLKNYQRTYKAYKGDNKKHGYYTYARIIEMENVTEHIFDSAVEQIENVKDGINGYENGRKKQQALQKIRNHFAET